MYKIYVTRFFIQTVPCQSKLTANLFEDWYNVYLQIFT